MKFPWKKTAIAGLGLESIRFDILGLTGEPEEAPNERYWHGPSLLLSQHWFAIPPDLPSLQEDEIRRTYEALLGKQGAPMVGRLGYCTSPSIVRRLCRSSAH